MISYIYEYENGIKKNNVGYARVEARNGQCKIMIHVKCASMNGKTLKAYIFHRDMKGMEGIFIGEMMPQNTIGEMRFFTEESNISGSSYGLNQMGGIVLYATEKRFLGTEWDDKPIDLRQFREWKKESKLVELKEQIGANSIEQQIEELAANQNNRLSVAECVVEVEQEEAIDRKEQDKVTKELVAEENKEKEQEYSLEQDKAAYIESNHIVEKEAQLREEVVEEVSKNIIIQEELETLEDQQKKGLEENKEIENKQAAEELSTEVEKQSKENTRRFQNQEKVFAQQEAIWRQEVRNLQKDITEKSAQRQTEANFSKEEGTSLRAEQILQKYPNMYPFEDNEIAACVRIEPQDIGVFPMEVWVLANNSFLLHGYYSYRHLIFAKRRNGMEYEYFIGIPGVYHNRERFMAQMFGFHRFKPIKRHRERVGEFGYWYQTIMI